MDAKAVWGSMGAHIAFIVPTVLCSGAQEEVQARNKEEEGSPLKQTQVGVCGNLNVTNVTNSLSQRGSRSKYRFGGSGSLQTVLFSLVQTDEESSLSCDM